MAMFPPCTQGCWFSINKILSIMKHILKCKYIIISRDAKKALDKI